MHWCPWVCTRGGPDPATEETQGCKREPSPALSPAPYPGLVFVRGHSSVFPQELSPDVQGRGRLRPLPWKPWPDLGRRGEGAGEQRSKEAGIFQFWGWPMLGSETWPAQSRQVLRVCWGKKCSEPLPPPHCVCSRETFLCPFSLPLSKLFLMFLCMNTLQWICPFSRGRVFMSCSFFSHFYKQRQCLQHLVHAFCSIHICWMNDSPSEHFGTCLLATCVKVSSRAQISSWIFWVAGWLRHIICFSKCCQIAPHHDLGHIFCLLHSLKWTLYENRHILSFSSQLCPWSLMRCLSHSRNSMDVSRRRINKQVNGLYLLKSG